MDLTPDKIIPEYETTRADRSDFFFPTAKKYNRIAVCNSRKIFVNIFYEHVS